MHCTFIISALLLVSQMIMGADAQLQFNPTSILIQPKIDEVSGTYICKVTNTTHAPVVITDVKGGCGCIRHLLGSKMLAAGASTDLTIMFDFGDYVGLQKRKIVIITKSEGQEQAIRNELPMTGEILTPLSFSSKAAIWLYGDRSSEKEIKIQIKKGSSVCCVGELRARG